MGKQQEKKSHPLLQVTANHDPCNCEKCFKHLMDQHRGKIGKRFWNTWFCLVEGKWGDRVLLSILSGSGNFHVAESGLQFVAIFLPHSPTCWDCKHTTSSSFKNTLKVYQIIQTTFTVGRMNFSIRLVIAPCSQGKVSLQSQCPLIAY